ncbi:MAG: CinA family protein [Burkholderiaceae bacterium]|nr:CinA family protein [Burkholderiaceae bacterium]
MTAQGGTEDETVLARLAAALGRAMRDAGGLIVTAESCTGGLIAQVLTETAGSSEWFDRGFVTYSNEAKVDLLGVSLATLRSEGAVSEAVAREMASGALKRSVARLALSVTGIAGPGGAVPGKPVGTVCFGWALALPDQGGEALVTSATRLLAGDRASVRRAAAAHALTQASGLLQQRLRDQPPVA